MKCYNNIETGNWRRSFGGEDLLKRQRKSVKRRKKPAKRRVFSQQLLGRLRKKLSIASLKDLKKKAFEAAVVKTKGDVTLAAALLGIGKTTLYRSRGTE